MSYKKYEEFGGPGGTIYILKILSKFKGENLVLGKFGRGGGWPPQPSMWFCSCLATCLHVNLHVLLIYWGCSSIAEYSRIYCFIGQMLIYFVFIEMTNAITFRCWNYCGKQDACFTQYWGDTKCVGLTMRSVHLSSSWFPTITWSHFN